VFSIGANDHAGGAQPSSTLRRTGGALDAGSSGLTALSRTPNTACVRCCQRRDAAHGCVSCGWTQPSAATGRRRRVFPDESMRGHRLLYAVARIELAMSGLEPGTGCWH
jgi:hypothetical protein